MSDDYIETPEEVYEPVVTPAEPKKSNNTMIIVIVVAVVLVLCLCACLCVALTSLGPVIEEVFYEIERGLY